VALLYIFHRGLNGITLFRGRRLAGRRSGPVRFRAAEVLELSQGIERFVPRALDTGNVLAQTIDQALHIEFAAGDHVRRFDGAVLRGELVLAGGGAHQEGLIEGGGEIAFQANEFGLGDRHLFDKGGFGGSGRQPFGGEVAADAVEIGIALEIEEVLFLRGVRG
jgi:hypothetical protein